MMNLAYTLFFVGSVWHLWIPIELALHIIAFVGVTAHCLMSRKEPASALLWIFVAWSFPLFGAFLYLALGINRVERKGLIKQKSNRRFFAEAEQRGRRKYKYPDGFANDSEGCSWAGHHIMPVLHSMFDAIVPEYPLMHGNRVSALVTGDEAYPRMMDAIRSARHHIHLQSYIVGNDFCGKKFLELLKAKAEEGVRIRFLYDRFGSSCAHWCQLFRKYSGSPDFDIVGWTQANLLKRQFQVNLRNHRKLLIVDGVKAFTGGINIHRENVTRPRHEPIRDYHFMVEGPVVRELQYTFLQDWVFMTNEPVDDLLCESHFPEIPAVGNARVRVINGGPSSAVETLTDVYFTALNRAEKEIIAVTPYFAPNQDILRAFRMAALRGVDVKLIFPAVNNHTYAGLAGQALYEDLMSYGVKIYERPAPFIHAKALIVDGAVSLVGTANLDMRSLRLNYETNIAVFCPGFASTLRNIVSADLAVSRAVVLTEWRSRPLRRRIAENFCSLLTPIL